MTLTDRLETKALILLVQLVHGRRCCWLRMSDPPALARPSSCPHCKSAQVRIHRRGREPVVDFRCRKCRKVFNVWQGTVFAGTHRTPTELLLLIEAIIDGRNNSAIAKSFGWQRAWVIQMARRLEQEPFVQGLAKAVISSQGSQQFNGLWPSDIRKLLRKVRSAARKQSATTTVPPIGVTDDPLETDSRKEQ